MDLSHLSVFIEVMREGTFAAVAKKRNIAPSTVSRIISGLEEAANLRLFERNTRNMEPTEQAQLLSGRLEPLLEEIDAVFAQLGDAQSKVAGKLRITSPVSFGLTFLARAVTEFGKLYPDVEVEYQMTDGRIDILGERIDVAFRFGHLEDSNFISQQFMPLKYIACASSRYLEDAGFPNSPKEISTHNCLSFLLPGFAMTWKFRKLNQTKVREYPVGGNLKISNPLALRQAVLNDHGIALLPEFIIDRDLQQGSLVNLFPEFEITATEFNPKVWIVYPSRIYLPTRTRVFLDFVKSRSKGFCEGL